MCAALWIHLSFVDILKYSKIVEEHIEHVDLAMKMLERCNLKAHPDKTVVGAATMEFLGHNVSAHGLLPYDAKILAIRNLNLPKFGLNPPMCPSCEVFAKLLYDVLGLLNYNMMCQVSA